MSAPPPPPSEDDPIALADWLEIRTLLAEDSSSSATDLSRARAGVDGDSDALTSSVLAEIALRQKACAGSYPFILSDDLVTYVPAEASWAYRFCLLVSVLDLERKANKPATKHFETVSAAAAARYLGGKATVFGAPNKGFAAALQDLASRIGEGEIRAVDAKRKKTGDEGLDVVAWKPHADGREGVVSIWGQCAAGKQWSNKLQDLNVDNFQRLFFTKQVSVKPVRAFFSPRRFSEDWFNTTVRGGMLFDRCRIAYHAGPTPEPTVQSWIEETLPKLKGRTIWDS